MRIGNHHMARMYLLTIALLVVLAVVGAYQAGKFPLALICAVVSCVLIEFVVVKATKKTFRVPLVAIITGLIIGSVAPITASILLVVLACFIAEATKFFLKAKSRNIFNPAALGLLIALLIFGVGDEWWATPTIHAFGFMIPIAAILIISAYEVKRLPLALVATVSTAIGVVITSGFGLSAGSLLTAFLTINYYFIFLMVVDPKTSPTKVSGQVIYGIGIALIALLLILVRIPYPLLLTLVVANAFYAIFRVFYKVKSVTKANTTMATS
jgi:Na+-translocating ferredoxin:NAD+ oxidoreductase RnfD subunit